MILSKGARAKEGISRLQSAPPSPQKWPELAKNIRTYLKSLILLWQRTRQLLHG